MPNDLPDWQRQAYTRLLLGSLSVAANTTSPVTNFVLPVGCLAVAFQANTQPAPPNNVTITGHTTGNVYFNGSPGSLFTSRFIDPQIDPSVDVTVTAPLALGSFVTFMAVEVPENVFVRNSSGEPIPVQTGTGGTVSTVDVTDRAARQVGIVQQSTTPPLWLAPNQLPAAWSFTLAPLATGVIVPAVAGQSVYVFDINYTAQTTSVGSQSSFQTTAGVNISDDSFITSVDPRPYRMSGAKLPVGLGLQFANTSGANNLPTVQGHVTYSQG